MTVLGELCPERITLRQSTFFLYAALADLVGRPATFSEIRNAVGPEIGKSLTSNLIALFYEGRSREGRRDVGYGWLMRESDPDDRRRKYIRLTATGRRVMAELTEALQTRNVH